MDFRGRTFRTPFPRAERRGGTEAYGRSHSEARACSSGKLSPVSDFPQEIVVRKKLSCRSGNYRLNAMSSDTETASAAPTGANSNVMAECDLTPDIEAGQGRHVHNVGILGAEGDDLHRLLEPDDQRSNDCRAAQFLQHAG